MAEDLEVLSVGLTVSTEQAAAQVDEFITRAADSLDSLNEAMEKSALDLTQNFEVLKQGLTSSVSEVEKVTSKMLNEMNKNIEEFVELTSQNMYAAHSSLPEGMSAAYDEVFKTWNATIMDAQEFANAVADTYRRQVEETVSLVEQMHVQISEIVNAYTARAELGGAIMGEPLSDEQIQRIRESAEEWYALAVEQGATTEAMAEFQAKMEELLATEAEIAHWNKLINDQIRAIKTEYEAMGQALPILEEQALRNEMQRLVDAGDKLGLSTQEIEEELSSLNATNLEAIQIDKQIVLAYEKINEIVEAVAAAYQKLGQDLPIEKERALRKELEQTIRSGNELGKSQEEIGKAMQRVGQEAIPQQERGLGKLQKGFMALAQRVTAAYGAYALLQKGVQFIQESIAVAQESVRVTTQLTIAVREHQRAVGELAPTIGQANAEAERLSSTYGLQLNQSKQLLSQTFLLTESIGLSADETFKLTESAVILADVFGKDPMTAMQAFTNFLNTGYTQGLQALGFDLDEHKLRVEAIKRGYIEYGEALDEATIKQLGMVLIEERADELRDDVLAKQSMIAQKIGQQNVELTKQKEVLGKFLLPMWEGVQLVLLKVATSATQLFTLITIGIIRMVGKVTANLQAAADLANAISEMGVGGVREEYGGIGKAFGVFREQRMEEAMAIAEDALQDAANAGKEFGDDFSAGMEEAGQAAEEFEDTLISAMDNVVPAINKALDEYNKKREKIELDLARRLDDITADFNRRREKAELDLNQKLQDIDQDARQRREESTREYQMRERRELEDHKIAMARLESKYLMDLEDAVRERDARAVLELRRRYNTERKEREDDFELNKKRRKEDFDLELAENAAKAQQRRAQAIEDFILEMQQLDEQEALRREQAKEAAARRLADLEEAHREKMNAIGRHIIEELKLTDEGLKALYDRLVAAYGPQGWIVDIIEGAYAYLNQAARQMAGTTVGPQGNQATYDYFAAAGDTMGMRRAIVGTGVQQYQRGGTFFATSPQLIQVGETPERVDITRLNAATGAPRENRMGMGGGRVEIGLNVSMEHGLMAEIADQTMNEVADVFINISNGGKSTGRGRR